MFDLPPNSKSLWHNQEIETVFSKLASSENGLDSQDANDRLKKFGPNQLKPASKKSPLIRFLSQFHNLFIYVLIASGIVTLLMQHWVDSAVIFAVVIINAIIGFIQEGKAEKALDAIRTLLSHKALVKRDTRFVSIPAQQLVPGDIVFVQSGDKVPADLRLFKLRELRIDEAMLTGESMPVEKNSTIVEENAVIADRKCLAYSGTLVTYGQGHGIVVATGDNTEIGRISGMLHEVSILATPLIKQMATFAKWLTAAIIAIATLTFTYGVFIHDYSASAMFIAAVGLAVAGIPEGLPAIVTITLAIGVQRMAKKNAIIRRLPAVETLGSVTVICSDKTGTLTQNEMTVKSLVTTTGQFDVSGTGYDPHGFFSQHGKNIDTTNIPILKQIAEASLLCNDSYLEKKGQLWTLQGDPTEGALLTLAIKAGLDIDNTKNQFPRIDAIPFESEHRFMATLHHDHNGHYFIYIKGAPERLLEMCSHQRMQDEDKLLDQDYWNKEMALLAGRGQRLLALAVKPLDQPLSSLNNNDIENGLSLLAITGLIDPPREEATTAVHSCQQAGIKVKMITGDHIVTAKAIGAQMGIGDGRNAVLGNDISTMPSDKLNSLVHQADIFARVSPEQKLQLVKLLQASGNVVAMTGDGVNDAPALKRADVGVAMGLKGTEVAREAAEVVLTDDNFASIAHAVEEGRTVYDNIKKSIMFVLPTNGGEALIIIAAIILGMQLPITPAQILWVNMITAVTLALSLAFEPAEDNVMQRPPRDPKEAILSGFLIWRILFVAVILALGTFALFMWERMNGASIELARTVSVNTLVMFEIFYLFSSRYLFKSALNRNGFLGNPYVLYAIAILLIFQLAFTYFPPMQLMFETRAMDFYAWVRAIGIASLVFILVEAEKFIVRKHVLS